MHVPEETHILEWDRIQKKFAKPALRTNAFYCCSLGTGQAALPIESFILLSSYSSSQRPSQTPQM